MGTQVRLKAINYEAEMTEDQFKEFADEFLERYSDGEQPDPYEVEAYISCSYSAANVKVLSDPFKEKWGKYNITFDMWFEERDPDETLEFGE